jgi:hypothetical protein
MESMRNRSLVPRRNWLGLVARVRIKMEKAVLSSMSTNKNGFYHHAELH